MKLQRKKVWDRRAEVRRSQSADRTADVVRSHGHSVHIGKMSDALRNRQAPDFLEIRSNYVERVLRNDFLKAFKEIKILSGCNGHADLGANFLQRGSVVRRNRIFEPQQTERFELPRYLNNVAGVIAPMAVDRNVGIFAYGVVHRTNQTHHVIDGAIAKRSIMRIGALRAGHVEVELQSGESLRSFLQSLAAIVVGRSSGVFASLGEIILRNICRAFCLPRRGAGTQYFVQALKCLASMAIGVDANSVT